jgi:hypothetical protein
MVEKDIGCTLLEKKQRQEEDSRNHKLAIVAALDLPFSELERFMNYSDFPDKLYVEKSYYSLKATSLFQAWFQNRQKCSLYSSIIDECREIKNKKEYDDWLVHFESKKPEYLPVFELETFNALKAALVIKLKRVPYFSDMTIEDLIPHIRPLKKFLETRVNNPRLRCLVHDFIENNNVDFVDIRSSFARTLLQNTLRYPQREPNDPQAFLIQLYPCALLNNIEMTWKGVVDFINNNTHSREFKCKLCTDSRTFTQQGLRDHARMNHR